jgi:hypothetical protein
MKKLFFLYLLLFTLTIACNNNSTSDEIKGSEQAVAADAAPEVEVTTADSKAVVEEEVDGKTSASEGAWEDGHSETPEEKIEAADQFVMDVFDPDYINGRWEAEDQNGYSFGAWFDTDEGTVIGQYCAMNHDASRIDCGTHEEVESCYLKSGPVKGKKILEIEVVSCYALKKGKATLSVQDDGNLVWRLVEPPGEFEVDHFAPEVALLRKVSFDPYE